MVRIADETLEEVRNAADIVDVVSAHVNLKRSGRNYFGLCPFHSEKSPSFSVSPEKQRFYCFGCGAGGNVFTFLMQLEGLRFPEAVRQLAERYGIAIQTGGPQGSPTGPSEREVVQEINRHALDFFRHGLLKSPRGEEARQYLMRRHITAETVHTFGLGYAPEAWELMRDHLRRKGFSDAQILTSGLGVQGKTNRPYDRFRNRVIFPIQDVGGRVIGFGGRVMDDGTPKYLNSPETPVYHKSRSLYGLRQARQAIRKDGRAFVVEGYFDVIRLHQAGIPLAIASLGTALTPEHVRLLKGYAKELVLVFDADDAGVRAAERAAPILLEAGIESKVLVLPKGEDPDSFVDRNGPEAFFKIADTAAPLLRFLVGAAIQRFGMSVAGRLQAMEALLPILAGLEDPVARDVYVREAANALNVEEQAIRERIRDGKVLPQMQRPAQPDPGAIQAPDRFEMQVTALLMDCPEKRDTISELQVVNDFADPILQALANVLLQGGSLDRIAMEDPLVQRRIAELSMRKATWDAESADKFLVQLSRKRNRTPDSLTDQIRAAENRNDQAQLEELLRLKNQKLQQVRQNAQGGSARATRRQTP